MKAWLGLAAVLIVAASCSSGTSEGVDVPAPGEVEGSDGSDVPAPSEVEGADWADGSDAPGPGEVEGSDVPSPSEVEGSDAPSPSEVEGADGADLAPDMVAAISGSVVDEDGKPIAGLFVQPCVYTETTESCLKAISTEDGTWKANVNPPRTIIGLHVRFVTNDYSAKACYYDFAEVPVEDNVVHFATPYKLYAMGKSVLDMDVAPEAPVTVEGEGMSFTVKPEEWFPGVFEPTSIRVRKLPNEFADCFAGPGEEPDVLFALSPDWLGFNTVGGIPVTFDNELGLAAGTKVSLYFLGALDATVRPVGGDPVLLKTGQWYLLGQGTVSSDGTSIQSDPGAGLPWLGVVGYRQ